MNQPASDARKSVHFPQTAATIRSIRILMSLLSCPMKRAHILLLILLLHPCASWAETKAAVTLIPAGAEWRYWDRGGTPPTSSPIFSPWNSRVYNDTGWSSGPAQFCYGEGDEATVVNFGPDPDTKYITTYFRRPFLVTNTADFNQLTLGVLRDDGVIVYL